MSFLRRQKVVQTPKPVMIEDPQNRIADQERRRLQTGGRASTWLSSAVSSAATTGPLPSLTGIG